MFTFDAHGNLTPDRPIEATLEELETAFVFNKHRTLIFKKLLEFFIELHELEVNEFLVWIDGSFVTRKDKPNDIDCVLFIDFKWVEKNERVLETILSKYSGTIDAYFVKIYPENHRFRVRTDSDRIEWLHHFTANRRKLVKGLIQINF